MQLACELIECHTISSLPKQVYYQILSVDKQLINIIIDEQIHTYPKPFLGMQDEWTIEFSEIITNDNKNHKLRLLS